ncbi:MAG: hypothetical protein WC812_01060 [Candidatus Pacearchaeota archaeon]|jgi:hypothetical protein
MLKKGYIKCNYSKGMFSDEYFVNFKGSFERDSGIDGNYLVMKDRVITKDESFGLLKIIILGTKGKSTKILIDGAKDVGAGVFFEVPNEEIIFN